MNEQNFNEKIGGRQEQEDIEIQHEKIAGSDNIYDIEWHINKATGEVLEVFKRDKEGILIEYNNIKILSKLSPKDLFMIESIIFNPKNKHPDEVGH